MSYALRYHLLREYADLEQAIEYRTQALNFTPPGHPDLAHHHRNLGISYADRYLWLDDLADLEKALENSTRALELTPDSHPQLSRQHFTHALHLFYHSRRTGDLSHLNASLESFRTASQAFTASPRDKFNYALRWANMASEYKVLNPMEAYQTTIDLLPEFVWLGATTNQRYQDLSSLQNLAVQACLAAIECSSYSIALEWLECARCVVWSQSVMLRAPLDELHASHPLIATRLRTVADELHSSGFEAQAIVPVNIRMCTPEQAGQERRRLANEFHNLLAQIRHLPGFEDFLQPVKAKMLMGSALHGPVVVLNCYSAKCDALLILPGHDSISHLPLSDFTEEKAKKARSDLDSSLKYQRIRERGVRVLGKSAPEDRFESVLAVLWTDIVKPVLAYLGYMRDVSGSHLPHITWCPTGTLSFLPLHAAGDYSQPHTRIFDYVVSSYTPTLTALLGSTPRSLEPGSRVLAIGQAITPGHNPLPGTTKELAHVKQHAQTRTNVEYSQLIDAEATMATVLDAMEQHDWVHLACHAHQNVNDPTKSGFYLHDGILDLSAINRKSFKNKGLAFLSACQTATGDEKLPDEAIHLASGMLMAGYPSVIATMWSVVDQDAPFVADKVYAQLMKDGKLEDGETGRALHNAIAGLREQVGEKEFGRWVPYIHIGS
ncbi:BAI1-associated protein 3 [Rhizoctonia solani]|uniref:BAI1-associated protein 3 n=1 Tax=Rhizoctonia solani TaxID=456999 RepID=A0A0K6GDF5_9AGAM|nr:BAI1-associated protein 3 [Rhizoctonia solani]